MKRACGVLMHVSSLHGDYSIGSFGKEAREFIDLLAESGFSYWQMLPFCMTDECNSPYKSYSAFGGNPFFIDLPTLFEKGLLTKEELEGLAEVLRGTNIAILSDEIYAELTYGRKHVSIAQIEGMKERTIIASGSR